MKYYNRKTDEIMMPSTFRWNAQISLSEREINIMKYAPLVMKVVNKFNRDDSRAGIFDKHDFIQSGFVGLVEGYDRIIKSDGKPNVNYLEINIKGTIDRYLNYQATGVAIPEYQMQKTKQEIVADRIFGAWMYSFRLDDINSKTFGKAYSDSIPNEHVWVLDSYETEELNDMLSDILWCLTNKERDILTMSYGINHSKKSIKEISDHFNMSEIGVKKIKEKIS